MNNKEIDTILKYIKEKGTVKANGVQLAEDLYSQLQLSVSGVTQIMWRLERKGTLKYDNGQYKIREQE